MKYQRCMDACAVKYCWHPLEPNRRGRTERRPIRIRFFLIWALHVSSRPTTPTSIPLCPANVRTELWADNHHHRRNIQWMRKKVASTIINIPPENYKLCPNGCLLLSSPSQTHLLGLVQCMCGGGRAGLEWIRDKFASHPFHLHSRMANFRLP